MHQLLRRALLAAGAALGLAAAAFVVVPAVRTARHDRVWSPDQAELPTVHRDGRIVTIEGVRNARYRAETDYDVRWERRTVHLDSLESVWVMVEPFNERPEIGHTLISFGFAGGEYLAFSAEVRKEPGETYGVWAGMLGEFELMMVVADERDVLGLRANHRRDSVYLYPLRLAPAERERVFLAALDRVEALRAKPALYHTLASNCTTDLVALLRAARADLLPARHWSYILTASFDVLLFDRGLIDTDLADVAAVRDRFRINARAAGRDTLPEFSRLIRGL